MPLGRDQLVVGYAYIATFSELAEGESEYGQEGRASTRTRRLQNLFAY